jgi:predicted phosphodiesterase
LAIGRRHRGGGDLVCLTKRRPCSADRAWDADPVLNALARFVGEEVRGGLVPDLVAITGDLAYAGKEDEYAMARRWLEERLLPALPKRFPRQRVLVVPGNHDVDREAVDIAATLTQDGLLAGRDQDAIAQVLRNERSRDLLLHRHSAYLAFLADWWGEPQPLPWGQRIVEVRGHRLHRAGLDSAWMSSGDHDYGRLLLGRYQVNHTAVTDQAEQAAQRIALLHHPWAYLAEFDGNEARKTLHQHCDLVLRGHLHETEAQRILTPDPNRACLELAAGCAYQDSRYPNALQWVELWPAERHARVHFRAWLHGGWNVGDPTPVGIYPAGATPEGLLDLAGNVWEWCLDVFDNKLYETLAKQGTVTNPVNATGVGPRVLRGGAFARTPWYLRAADRVPDIGFRCALAPRRQP